MFRSLVVPAASERRRDKHAWLAPAFGGAIDDEAEDVDLPVHGSRPHLLPARLDVVGDVLGLEVGEPCP
jgi:hypothetical protein